MDTTSFPAFSPLLSALSDYAASTGYRFKLSDFQNGDFEIIGEPNVKIVQDFTSRIRAGDPALISEISTANKLSEQEGIRNVMIATCKELRLWPPSTADGLQSIAYTDMSEPLDNIAWALYNHDKCLREDGEIPEAHRRLLRTASFIVDFAHAIGSIDVSETSKSGSQLLMAFLLRAKEWTDMHEPQQRKSLRRIVMEHIRDFADDQFIKEMETWLDRHWEAVAVGGIALALGLVIGALALSSKGRK